MKDNDFPIQPPKSLPKTGFKRNDGQKNNVPSVWAQIMKEQEQIIKAPAARAKDQKKTDIELKFKTVTSEKNKSKEVDDENDGDFFDLRSRIETLLDEHRIRAIENESNLVELRIVLENLNSTISEEAEPDQIDEAAKYMGQVQEGQNRLQESISYLVKGAAQLFVQKNKLKVEKLRSDINDLAFMTSQIDEEIRIKNGILEEKLNNCAKIESSNASLRRRIENTKNEIRAIAGQDFEQIPELAKMYNETMKKILAEEVELTKQLWNLQAQLEKEKKEQVQMSLMYQKVKDHPIKVAQLTEEMEAKLSSLRSELYEKEKSNSYQRGQLASSYQSETQQLVMQARKEREELIFTQKTQQIQLLLQAEKQSRDDKIHLISSLNTNVSSNKNLKAKMNAFDRESKALVDQYDKSIRQIKSEFGQAEKRIRKEEEQKISERETEFQKERLSLENDVASMEALLASKNDQYQHSSSKLSQLQEQLAQLKEKIARMDSSNQQLERALGGNENEADDLLSILQENLKRKTSEKDIAIRQMMDAITTLSYFLVLSGEKDGDWMVEAKQCFEEALSECEKSGNFQIPIPFSRNRKTKEQLFQEKRPKPKRRNSG